MADKGEMKAHEATYAGFVKMLTWGAGVAFVTVFILLVFIY